MGTLWNRQNGPKSIAASASNQSGLNVQANGAATLPVLQSIGGTTETVIANPQNAAVALVVPLPPNQFEQQLFNVVATGYIATGNTTNVTLKLYSGSSLTVGSNVLLGTSGAIAQNTSKAPFFIKAELIYDSVSGKLDGVVQIFVNHTLVASAAISNTITGVNNANDPVANFVLSLTSSAADATHLTTINVQTFTAG